MQIYQISLLRTPKQVSYPAHIVSTFCGDGLEDHLLAANAEENFLNFVQEFLQKEIMDE